MKVKELIQSLRNVDPDAEVKMLDEMDEFYDVVGYETQLGEVYLLTVGEYEC